MDNVAQLSQGERDELFNETAAKKGGINPVIVEKDFWVCWVLGKLFTVKPICQNIIFKGGTSLSKVFKAINRFSEDVDLSISREILGLSVEDYLTKDMGSNEIKRRIKALEEKSIEYIQKELLPLLEDNFTNVLGKKGNWSLTIDGIEPKTLLFAYPSDIKKVSDNKYLKNFIQLEFGAYSDHQPSSTYEITPYAAEEFPDYFKSSTCKAKTLEIQRTFWEKATLLHCEHHRPLDKQLPERYSRHYYDACLMIKKGVGDKSLQDISLLEKVRNHKSLFYRSAWARWDEAKIGTLKLTPADERVDALKRDYQLMQEMIFSDFPTFDEIMKILADFERKINK